MGFDGHRHAPAVLPPGIVPMPIGGGRVGSRARLDGFWPREN